jgi:hypothetical protein
MGLMEVRFLGATKYLEHAIQVLDNRGFCKNMYMNPYSKNVSATGALLSSFGVPDENIISWSGDITELPLIDRDMAMCQELLNLLEGLVDDDLESWSDKSSKDEVEHALKRLINLIEISVT